MPYDLLISVAQLSSYYLILVGHYSVLDIDFKCYSEVRFDLSSGILLDLNNQLRVDSCSLILDSTTLYFNSPLPAGRIKMLYWELNSSTENE